MSDDFAFSPPGSPQVSGPGEQLTREEFKARNKALRFTGRPAPDIKPKPKPTIRSAGYDPNEMSLETERVAKPVTRPPLKGRSEDFPGSVWEQRPELKTKLQEYISQGRIKPSGAEPGSGRRRAEADSTANLAKELGLTRNQIIGKLNRMRKESS